MRFFKLKRATKQKLKEKIASDIAAIVMLASCMPGFIFGNTTPVQAAGPTSETESRVDYYGKTDGMQTFNYGTSFHNDDELRSYLVDSVSDTEDKTISVSKVELTNLKAESDVENVLFDKTSQAWEKKLATGTYTASFRVKDSGGKYGYADISFKIGPIPAINPTLTHKYYLQGTPITNELLSRGAKFLDTVAYKYLTYTEGPVIQGTYSVVDWGGLDSNKIMNNSNGYDFEYYMTHKDECDAQNTYTIKYAYKGNGDTKVSYATSKVTIIPVFPTFTRNEADYQIFEGYAPVLDANGKIASFTNKLGIDYFKQTNTLNLHAWSITKGDVDNTLDNREDCSDSLYFHSITYADGSVETGKDYITTSNGVYGNDLKGTQNDDGTFTLEDGSIYPYRGAVGFVVGATNSYKNRRLSSYDTEFNHKLTVHNPDPIDKTQKDQLIPVPNTDDTYIGFILKPQTDPIINGSDRYMYVGEEIDKDSILSKLEAGDINEYGEITDITGDIVIESIEKLDTWGNSLGQIYINDTDMFAAGKLEEGISYLSTEEECNYIIKFVIKNNLGRTSSFKVTMHVVDTAVKKPYIRYTKLEYAIKIPENLDDDGYNVYYDKDSKWMNDKETYTFLMYALCDGLLGEENVTGDEYILMCWKFTHDQVLVTQSWHNDSGVALAGQPVPEGTVVNGCLFEDDNGPFLKYRDEDTNKMIKVYIDPDTIDYGMFPSEELNQKFYDTWYDECCVIDMQLVQYQGNRRYSAIFDEDGNYLYVDKNTGKRMVFNNAMNDLKITEEDLARYEAEGYIWEDTRDYSSESVYEYGLRTMIAKYQKEINSNPNLALLNRVMDTIDHFDTVEARARNK